MHHCAGKGVPRPCNPQGVFANGARSTAAPCGCARREAGSLSRYLDASEVVLHVPETEALDGHQLLGEQVLGSVHDTKTTPANLHLKHLHNGGIQARTRMRARTTPAEGGCSKGRREDAVRGAAGGERGRGHTASVPTVVAGTTQGVSWCPSQFVFTSTKPRPQALTPRLPTSVRGKASVKQETTLRCGWCPHRGTGRGCKGPRLGWSAQAGVRKHAASSCNRSAAGARNSTGGSPPSSHPNPPHVPGS